jgi:general secretion pathway protein M
MKPMDTLNARIADVQNWLGGLTARERRLVAIAAAAVGVFILFIVFFSFSSTAAATRRRTEAKIAKLQQVQALAASYREAEQARQNVERQLTQSNVQLISYLEDKGTNAGLDIRSMNPKGEVPLRDGKIVESSVEVTLTDVELNHLVEFLSEVERGPGVVKVTRLRLEPRPENQKITAWATVSTYSMKR